MDGLGLRGGKKGINRKDKNQDEFYPVFCREKTTLASLRLGDREYSVLFLFSFLPKLSNTAQFTSPLILSSSLQSVARVNWGVHK